MKRLFIMSLFLFSCNHQFYHAEKDLTNVYSGQLSCHDSDELVEAYCTGLGLPFKVTVTHTQYGTVFTCSKDNTNSGKMEIMCKH